MLNMGWWLVSILGELSPDLPVVTGDFLSELPIVIIDSFARRIPSPEEEYIDGSLLVPKPDPFKPCLSEPTQSATIG